jgi:ParB family chromosome partitioning protein
MIRGTEDLEQQGGHVRPRGLGRGLGALIPAAGSERSGSATAAEAVDDDPAADEPSETVRALDRWLWRSGEATLPTLPGHPSPGPSNPGRALPTSDVPRGTIAELTVVPHQEHPGPSTSEADVELAAPGGSFFAELEPAWISPNPRQPRQVFEPEAIAELAASIREVGLLQPIVVRQVGTERYELVMGERRWRACQMAGLERVPAIVKPTGDDVLLRDALLENIQRVQLNPLEEAAAYGQLLEDFGCTQDELATRLGRSRPQVTNTIRLLRLSPPVQRRVAAGVLSAGHAKALLGLSDADAQELLAGRIVAEGLSVRSVEELVSTGAAGSPGRARAGRPRLPTAGPASAIADRIGERLETRVSVTRSRSRGRLIIEFANDADLLRIVDLIDPNSVVTSQDPSLH